jgi:hypothetical protein
MWTGTVAKVLVQSKNLLKQKGGPIQCLDDAYTSQHLTLLGGLLKAVCRLYSGPEPIKGVQEGFLSQSATSHSGGNISCEEQERRTRSRLLYPL